MALVGNASSPDEASIRSAAVKRLRALGVNANSCRPHSNSTRPQSGSIIFGAPLNAVPQQNVKCCGQLVQIPALVHQLCTALKSHLSVEGLFRKAGSQMRQKEIKRALDCGGRVEKSYHAVDLASLLKQYLRALPEPVIKSDFQEILVRCLLLPESDRLCAINLSLLIMSTSHLHLLHYIMEFFKCVSSKCDSNKMDCNNLAIVIAPTIMPPPLSCPPQRMDYHLKLVKILIENANMIGIVPENMCIDDAAKEVQKKKKRRSGSLTRMFTGLRKMVTNSTSSNKPINPEVLATPVLDKGQNKRKQEESRGFSAKKRKEILDSLPVQALSTPIRPLADKEQKKLRLSIGRRAKDKKKVSDKKSKENQYCGPLDRIEKSSQDFDMNMCISSESIDLSNNKDADYVRIPKSEYEAIKNRVSAIENRISQEFNVMTGIEKIEPVHQVQTAYEKTLEEAAMLSSPGSEQIARRRSRELKIRQSGEHKIIRSPSARKIGIIRRRSREINTKLIRTQTWTVSSQSFQNVSNKTNQFYTAASLRRGRPNTVNTGLLQPNNVNNGSDKYLSNDRGSFHTRSPSIDNDILTNRDFLLKNRTKRPSSFHGHVDIGDQRNKMYTKMDCSAEDENKWKNPRSFLSSLDNVDNPLTGRASVAKLRSQMAGMVLAKARLFDGMTDSDSSLEKKINKPSRQVSSFARKSRRCISPEKNAACDTSDDFSPQPETKLSKKTHYKSPGFVSKRHKNRATRSPLANKKNRENLNLSSQLKEVIYDICTPLSEKVNLNNCQTQKLKESSRNNAAFKSPRSTPQIKKSLNPKSSVGLKNSQNNIDMKRVNTPMRANHNTPRRQSPRLVSMKARQLV